jgi:hypothetical protein
MGSMVVVQSRSAEIKDEDRSCTVVAQIPIQRRLELMLQMSQTAEMKTAEASQ